MKSLLRAWREALMSKNGPDGTTRAVLNALAMHMRSGSAGNAYECWPSTRLLAEESGFTERTVCTHLEKAERAGWLVRTERKARIGVKHLFMARIPAVAAAEKGLDQEAAMLASGAVQQRDQPVSAPLNLTQLTAEGGSVEREKKNITNSRVREEDLTPAERACVQGGLKPHLLNDHSRAAIQELVDDGATLEELREACERASKQVAHWGVAYITPRVRDRIAKRQRSQNGDGQGDASAPWHSRWSRVVSRGVELGVIQGDGEPDHAFKARVMAAHHEAGDNRGAA